MRYAIYDDTGDLYAYATSRKDADKAARECGGSVVDQQRKGLEGPFRAASGKVTYYDPREGLYYDPTSDMYLERDEDPFARRNPRPTGLPDIEGGNTYFMGAYRAAVMQASSIPKGVDKEYARGWRTGMKIAKDHPAAVAYAQGVYEVEQDIPRAGQAMIEHVREQEQRAALGGVDKRRNPRMTQKRAKQLLGKMPSNITLDINGHDVRRVGPEHYVIGGKRCSTDEAAKKVAK